MANGTGAAFIKSMPLRTGNALASDWMIIEAEANGAPTQRIRLEKILTMAGSGSAYFPDKTLYVRPTVPLVSGKIFHTIEDAWDYAEAEHFDYAWILVDPGFYELTRPMVLNACYGITVMPSSGLIDYSNFYVTGYPVTITASIDYTGGAFWQQMGGGTAGITIAGLAVEIGFGPGTDGLFSSRLNVLGCDIRTVGGTIWDKVTGISDLARLTVIGGQWNAGGGVLACQKLEATFIGADITNEYLIALTATTRADIYCYKCRVLWYSNAWVSVDGSNNCNVRLFGCVSMDPRPGTAITAGTPDYSCSVYLQDTNLQGAGIGAGWTILPALAQPRYDTENATVLFAKTAGDVLNITVPGSWESPAPVSKSVAIERLAADLAALQGFPVRVLVGPPPTLATPEGDHIVTGDGDNLVAP